MDGISVCSADISSADCSASPTESSKHRTAEKQPFLLLESSSFEWTTEALGELNKIPGFVRSKVKRNTEKYAQSINTTHITVEIMYAAKEAVQA